MPGSVFIKDLKKLVSPPPLIDLTVDDEEENKVNMRNSINLIGSLSQNSNVQYSETLQVHEIFYNFYIVQVKQLIHNGEYLLTGF